jgi:hypothetical protein
VRKSRIVTILVAVSMALLITACGGKTLDATDVGETAATLNAEVSWNAGEDLAWWFQYRRVGDQTWIRGPKHDPPAQPCPKNPCSSTVAERISRLDPD